MEQLKSEINRIADSANFNGIKLLDGKMDAGGREVSGDFIIPDEGKTLGTETLLRTSGTEKAKSSLTLDLDTLEWDAKTNDKLEINIGDETITVTADADGKIDAKALAQKVADAFNNGDKQFGADDVATTATANGTSVTFTADAEGKGFDVNQDVTMKLTTAGGDIMELNAGVIVPMANTGAIDNTDAKNDIALKDTTTGTAEAKDALATFLDGQDAADGNVSVKYENSKWSISVGDKSIEATATVNEGVLSLSISDGQNNVEVLTITASDKGGPSVNDEAAFQAAFGTAVDTGIKYVAPAGGTDPVDPPPEKPELKNDVTSGEVLDGAGINFKNADLTQEKLDATKLAAVTGKITITDATADIEIDLDEVAKNLTATSSADDLVKGILAEANKAIEAWNTANAETAGYKYGNVRISNDGTQGGIIAQAAGQGIKVMVDQQPLVNDPPANSPLSGNFNAATTKNVVGSDGKAGQYASTTFELKNIVDKGNLDGAVVEIAGEKYTFKLGDGYSIDGNTITLDKSLTGEALLDQAGTGLSKMANKNFTIGHEGNGKIVIDEMVWMASAASS